METNRIGGLIMNQGQQRAEFKRRRTVAINKLREAGMTEAEIREELAKLQSDYDLSASSEEGQDSVENLPAVIDSADREGAKRSKDRTFPGKPNRDEHGNSTIKENVAVHDSKLTNNAERRCNGTNSLGEQCRSFAIKGGRVCKFHGGATRHVKEKARIRVEMASDRLMGKLIDIAYDDTRPAAVQLDAIKDSLNRAGLTKPAQVEVGPIRPFEEVFDDIAGGSRADYRAGVGNDDTTQLDDLYTPGLLPDNDYSGPEDVDYQRDSPPQTAGHDRRPATPRTHGDSDPLSGPSARRRPARDRWQGAEHITGEDAIRVANRVNAEIGALRALPPGRGE